MGGWRRNDEEKGAVVAKTWPSDAVQMDGRESVRYFHRIGRPTVSITVFKMATYPMQTRLICKLLSQSLDLHPMARLRGGEFNHLNPPTIAFVNKKPL
jgi:hypothetical protein